MADLVVAETGEFPDVELLVRLYLRQVALDGQPVTVTDEPRNPLEPPVITVLQVPGPGPIRARSWETVRRVETACMGRTRADSRDMARQIENLMLDLPKAGFMNVQIDPPIGQNTSPAQVPYAPDVRRIPVVWDITVRRHRGDLVMAGIAAPTP